LPTYQYRCTECGHAFEQFQSFADDALTVCPECTGRLRKVFNAVGVVFKGSGFYRTDSRGSSAPSESPAAKATAASEKSGSDTSTSSDSSSTSSDSSSKSSKSSDTSAGSATAASTSGGSGSAGS
jgi:putative FmdB family regulatory protein